MGDCEKGFIVEIAGTEHPDPPKAGRNNVSLEIFSAADGSLLPWADRRAEGKGVSPRTYYMADLGPNPSEKRYYLSLLLPDGSMRAVWPRVPAPESQQKQLEEGQDNAIQNKGDKAGQNWLRPTGCRDMEREFQKFVFIPFRPMTMLPVMDTFTEWRQGQGRFQARSVYQGEAWFNKLRTLRKGYLYVFHQGRLWREMEIVPGGALLEISLFSEEPQGGSVQRVPRDGWGKKVRKSSCLTLCEEVWIPARLDGAAVAGEYSIAFSDSQWEWTYIEWLEKHWEAGQKRFQSLEELWEVYTVKWQNPVDIAPEGDENDAVRKEGEHGRFWSVPRKHPLAKNASSLQHDAFFNHTTLADPELWTKRPSPFGPTEDAPNCPTDATLWNKFTGGNAAKKESCEENPLQPVSRRLEGEHDRGIFVVEDPLYAAAFYAAKANSALTLLDTLNAAIKGDEVVGPANHVRFLTSYGAQTQEIQGLSNQFTGGAPYIRADPDTATMHLHDALSACLNMPKLATATRLRFRMLLRMYVYAAQEQLALLINPAHRLRAVAGLPGLHSPRAYGPLLNAALRDLFMREDMADYIQGFYWMHSIADGMGRSALEADLLEPKFSVLHESQDLDMDVREVLGSLDWLDETRTTRIGPTALACWHTFLPDGERTVEPYEEEDATENTVPGLLQMLFPDPRYISIERPFILSAKAKQQPRGFCRVAEIQAFLSPNREEDPSAARLAGLAARFYQCHLDLLLSPVKGAPAWDMRYAMGFAANMLRLAAGMEDYMVMTTAGELAAKGLVPLVLAAPMESGVQDAVLRTDTGVYRKLDDKSLGLYEAGKKGALPLFLATDPGNPKLEKAWYGKAASILKKIPEDSGGGGAHKSATTWLTVMQLEVSCRNAQALVAAMSSGELRSDAMFVHACKLLEQLGKIAEGTLAVTASAAEIYFFYSCGVMAGVSLPGTIPPAVETLRRAVRFAGLLTTAVGLLGNLPRAQNAWRQGDYLSAMLYCLSPFCTAAGTAIGSTGTPVGGIVGMLLGAEIGSAMEEWALKCQTYPKLTGPLTSCYYGKTPAAPKSGKESRDIIKALYSPAVVFVEIVERGTTPGKDPSTQPWSVSGLSPKEQERACACALRLWKDSAAIQGMFHGFWPAEATARQITIILWPLFCSPAVAGQFVPLGNVVNKVVYFDSEPAAAVLQQSGSHFELTGELWYRGERLMPVAESHFYGKFGKAFVEAFAPLGEQPW